MDVNIWAIVLSAVASMVIGSIWYGALFGKVFEKACGMDQWTPQQKAEAQKKMASSYILQLVASLVMFYVLAMFISDRGDMTVVGGIVTGLWVWIGFIVPTQLGAAIWGGNMTLFWLGAGNMLATMVASGAIIGAMK
jgi:hypothetical protein